MTWRKAVKRSPVGFAYAIYLDSDGKTIYITNKHGVCWANHGLELVNEGATPAIVMGEVLDWRPL